jgi:YD repeat-containing protein
MTNFLQVTSFDPLIVSEPQGPQGPQGQPGPAGPAGVNGGVASIDGQTGAVDLSGKYQPSLQNVASYTYNADGTVATATEGGITTAYTYNADGTVATATRQGVTRTYSYNADGTVSGVS